MKRKVSGALFTALCFWSVQATTRAQSAFTTLHNFSSYQSPSYTNNDGAHPQSALILSGQTLYGTTSAGGSFGNGTVFAVNTTGAGFAILHSFATTYGSSLTNSDGAHPHGPLVLSGNTLYGTTATGGNAGNGTVFSVNINDTGFTNLYSFTATTVGTNSDGAHPQTGLVLSDSTLYGTAVDGGNSGNGALFRVNTDGTSFTNLHSFQTYSNSTVGARTNSGGIWPYGAVVIAGTTLYGTANQGGISGNGTVFKVRIDGSGFTTLYNFPATIVGTNSDGAMPYGGLLISGNRLYGTANRGGITDEGTVFALTDKSLI